MTVAHWETNDGYSFRRKAVSDIVQRLRACALDKDNFPNMRSERKLSVGDALEAADEIERLRTPQERGPWVSRNATIERCALVADEYLSVAHHYQAKQIGLRIAAAIRTLKDKP